MFNKNILARMLKDLSSVTPGQVIRVQSGGSIFLKKELRPQIRHITHNLKVYDLQASINHIFKVLVMLLSVHGRSYGPYLK